MILFEKFGEFDSVQELNEAADGLLTEGDIDSLRELAKENGIDEADLQDYLDGCSEDLANVSTAAFGRLYVEEQNAKSNKGEGAAVKVIFTVARSLCMRTSFCSFVVRKGKRVMDIFNAMRAEAKKHASEGVGLSCGTDRELSNIIMAYYTQGEDEMKRLLAKLYE